MHKSAIENNVEIEVKVFSIGHVHTLELVLWFTCGSRTCNLDTRSLISFSENFEALDLLCPDMLCYFLVFPFSLCFFSVLCASGTNEGV